MRMQKMWNASRFCVSSLRRGHANLLCIVPILVYVQPKLDNLVFHFNIQYLLNQINQFSSLKMYAHTRDGVNQAPLNLYLRQSLFKTQPVRTGFCYQARLSLGHSKHYVLCYVVVLAQLLCILSSKQVLLMPFAG